MISTQHMRIARAAQRRAARAIARLGLTHPLTSLLLTAAAITAASAYRAGHSVTEIHPPRPEAMRDIDTASLDDDN
ncbi:hypothetical protein ACFXKG_30700 [Streptomyces sp. NPDC059255]|uniref:hypothetical protein n=1 Tax=Streptomyces sp. NPDC059255 TaxID=3346793 RepID=UPI00368E70CE